MSEACLATVGGLSLGIVNGSSCSSVESAVVRIRQWDATGAGLGGCSGTVIAPRAVLTAGHCVSDETYAVDVDPGTGVWVRGASFIPLPSFRTSLLDVGIVLTAEALPRVPVPILTSREARVGESAVIAGWGMDGTGLPGTVRAGVAEIARVGTGAIETEYVPGGAGSGICVGDSGGPLLVPEGGVWAVAGIAFMGSQKVDCAAAATGYYVKAVHPEVRAFIANLVPDAIRR